MICYLQNVVGFINTKLIPNNKDNKLTNYFMEKTYKYLYGDLIE